jgi:hypothetical protein
MKKLCLIVVCLLISICGMLNAQTAAQRPSNWAENDGTDPNYPLLISSLANLRWLSENGEWVRGTSKIHFLQTEDINALETRTWNGGLGFRPIASHINLTVDGVSDRHFIGVYDGQHHEIQNLFIDRSGNENQVGLFLRVSGINSTDRSVIRNVRLTNVNIRTTSANNTVAGGIASIVRHAKIENCFVSGNIYSINTVTNASRYEIFAGGIVGEARGTTSITENQSDANVNTEAGNGGYTTYFYSGGIVGSAGSHTLISNCISTGIISAQRRVVNTRTYAYSGGILGRAAGNNVTIDRCYAIGSLRNPSGIDYRGGILGRVDGGNPTVSRSIYNTQTTGVSNLIGGGTTTNRFLNGGLDTTDMLLFSSYYNREWDIGHTTTNIWGINQHINYGYPYLVTLEMPIPELLSPPNNYEMLSRTPMLSWRTTISLADGYYVYMGSSANPYNPSNPTMNRVTTVDNGTTTQWQVTPALNYFTTYHWQIVAKKGNKLSPPSESWSFRTANNTDIALVSPAYNEPNVSLTPTFVWTQPAGNISGYHIYLGSSTNPYDHANPTSNRVHTVTNPSITTWQHSNTLSEGTTYHWQVVTYTSEGLETASNSWRFTTLTNIPIVPSINDARAPLLVRVTDIDNGDVLIEWEKPLNAHPDAYIVWKNIGGVETPITASVPPFSVTKSRRSQVYRLTADDNEHRWIMFGVSAYYGYTFSESIVHGHSQSTTIGMGVTTTIGGGVTVGVGYEVGVSGQFAHVTASTSIESNVNWSIAGHVETSLSNANSFESGLTYNNENQHSEIQYAIFENRNLNPPRNLTILPQTVQGRIPLRWQPPTGSSPEGGYIIYRDGFAYREQPYVDNIDFIEFTDSVNYSVLLPGSGYTYWVTAVSEDGIESNESNKVRAHLIAGIRPDLEHPIILYAAGSINNPYLVSSLGHLRWISEYAPSHLEYDGWWVNPGEPIYFRQTEDIDASDTHTWNGFYGDSVFMGFRPIGYSLAHSDDSFFGHYDGNGFSISNLFVNTNNFGMNPAGLFSKLNAGRDVHGNETPNGSTVRNLTLINPTILGNVIAGGITGEVCERSQIINCQVINGHIEGFANVGGIAGLVTNESIIRGCYFSGEIAGNAAGGIVGSLNSSTIRDSYSRAVVIAGYNGGIAGITKNASIINTYSLSDNSDHGEGWGGKIAGYSLLIFNPAFPNTTSNNFYDVEKACQSAGFGFISSVESQHVSGRTSEQMKQQATFTGWDFVNVWAINPELNEGYPYLRYQEELLTDETDFVIVRNRVSLNSNYPNPFNPETTISFTIANNQSDVSIEVFNIKGQKVRTLVSDKLEVGEHSVVWNGTDDNGRGVASGIYFYRMRAGDFTATRKMILMK